MSASPTDAGPIGLLGGTFDPIHIGHLCLGEEARDLLGLSEVRFIPAGDPPHRDAPATPARHRLELVRLAVADNPAFAVDPCETGRSGKSYTVTTLQALRSRVGAYRPLVLILGADAFHGLPGWHRWTELIGLAHIAVASRPGTLLAGAVPEALASRIVEDPRTLHESPAGCVVPFHMTPLAVSASLVRELLASGRSARYLLPNPVLDYIARHHLYR